MNQMESGELILLLFIICATLLIGLGIIGYNRTIENFVNNGYVQTMTIGNSNPIWIKE